MKLRIVRESPTATRKVHAMEPRNRLGVSTVLKIPWVWSASCLVSMDTSLLQTVPFVYVIRATQVAAATSSVQSEEIVSTTAVPAGVGGKGIIAHLRTVQEIQTAPTAEYA